MKKWYKIVICMAACLFLAACVDEESFGIVETADGSFPAVMANGETAGTDSAISEERSKEDAGDNVTEASGEHADENTTEASGEHADENTTETSTKEAAGSTTEKSSESVTEKPSKKAAESETIKPTQKATQAPTEAATQSVTQAPTEAETVTFAQVPTQAPAIVPTEMPSTEPAPTQGAEQMTPDQTEAVTQAEIQTPTEGVTQAATEPATEPAPMNDMQMRVANNVWVYSEFAQKVIGLTNIKRKESGLPMLQYDANLCKLATHRCFENIDNNIFSHTRPDGTPCYTIYDEYGLVYVAAAENLAAGQTTAEQVVEAWLNSPLHRENIYGNYDYIGVGIAVDDTGCYYWAQCFATYR